MILPTLKSLVLPINHDPNIEDTKLIQQVLSSILLDSSNVSPSPNHSCILPLNDIDHCCHFEIDLVIFPRH